ncbi:sigma-70 family RNA polymerase sigma factor [Adhaeribacter arboris]|uniref:Sigma-70 family RNA polymerase sigma factor n=1 Tax=Adhaeribacter arboris TaxID=2072846 RepID=A0A2T2YCG1_9BACT|nr:sigma-70 family RNA polymerase sigma factor [Adhaeribacter arboris]PSR53210.1 sigma-70 family RNA polymerase sigma factor [Adhaeribacter arboris]
MFFRKNSKTFDLQDALDGCLKGKQKAQKKLYEQYYSFAKGICLRYAANQEEAEEMVNDGFLRVFAKLELYDRSQTFEAWFRTVVVRTSIDYFRRNHSKIVLMDIQEAPEVEFEDALLEKLSAAEIMELVQKLPPAYRTVFSLFVVEGYNHAEIGEMLDINEGTSRSNLAKARGKLQDWIQVYLSESKKQANYVQRAI